MDTSENIKGQIIRYYRKDRRLTLTAVSKMLNCDPALVSRYENDKIIPRRETLEQFAIALNLSDQEKETLHQAYAPERSRILDNLGDAPDVRIFYGREHEINALTSWLITDKCRLIGILGMGGIGKTTLAIYLAAKVKPNFDYVIWRSLRNAPPLDELLSDCLDVFNPQSKLKIANTQQGINLLLSFLRKNRCLLILDNLETIFVGGEFKGSYRDGYNSYGEFLTQVGQTSHMSCVIFTSREKPIDTSSITGYSSPVRNINLGGLDPQQARKIVADKNLKGDDKDWDSITVYYSGNPLALRLVADTIHEDFQGNIRAFLKEGLSVFGKINDLLDEQFKRLSQLEQEFLYWLAVEGESTSITSLSKNLLHHVTQRDMTEARSSLNRRSMVVLDNKGNLSLQNVIAEYLINLLITKICQEISKQDIDLFNRIALIKANAKEYVRSNQIRLILKPVADYFLASTRNKKNLFKQFIQLLDFLREVYMDQSGYAAGNLINLMVTLGFNLQGLNFTGLPIWQAYLQNIELHNTNFNGCDFKHSMFTDTFSAVLSVSFNFDGTLLGAGMTDRQVAIWQMPEGKLLFTNRDHGDWVYSICFSPNGEILASGSYDHTVRLWDVQTGKCINILHGHTSPVSSLKFDLEGKTLISAGESDIKFWNIDTGECLDTVVTGSNLVWYFCITLNGQFLALGTDNGDVQLLDIFSRKFIKSLIGHTKRLWCVDVDRANRIIASGGDDHTVRLWDINTGQCLSILEGHTQAVRSVLFIGTDKQILCSASQDKTIKFWDIRTGTCIKTLDQHTNIVRSLSYNSDNNILASASDDQSIRLWDTNTKECVKILRGYTNRLGCIAFSPTNNNLIACGYEDHTIRLWNIKNGQCLMTLEEHTGLVVSIAFSPDGHIIASTGEDRTICLWSTDSGSCIGIINLDMWGRSLTFSSDGKLLCCGNENADIQVWDTATLVEKNKINGHRGWIRTIANHPENQIIVSGSDDNTVKIWDLNTGKCLKTFTGHTACVRAVAFSSDGKFIASASDDCSIKLWSLKKSKCIRTMKGHDKPIWSIGFDAQNSFLASGSEDMSVRSWDIQSGLEVNKIIDHTTPIVAVAFSKIAPIFATSSEDGTIKIWNTETKECVKTINHQRPYERMNMIDVTGLSDEKKISLQKLGAITKEEVGNSQ